MTSDVRRSRPVELKKSSCWPGCQSQRKDFIIAMGINTKRNRGLTAVEDQEETLTKTGTRLATVVCAHIVQIVCTPT